MFLFHIYVPFTMYIYTNNGFIISYTLWVRRECGRGHVLVNKANEIMPILFVA